MGEHNHHSHKVIGEHVDTAFALVGTAQGMLMHAAEMAKIDGHPMSSFIYEMAVGVLTLNTAIEHSWIGSEHSGGLVEMHDKAEAAMSARAKHFRAAYAHYNKVYDDAIARGLSEKEAQNIAGKMMVASFGR